MGGKAEQFSLQPSRRSPLSRGRSPTPRFHHRQRVAVRIRDKKSGTTAASDPHCHADEAMLPVEALESLVSFARNHAVMSAAVIGLAK